MAHIATRCTATPARPRAAQGGVSVIELMLALALLLIVVAGLLDLLAGSRQNIGLQGELERMGVQGRQALDVIGAAASGGGSKADAGTECVDQEAGAGPRPGAIRVYAAGGGVVPALPSWVSERFAVDSDVLVLRTRTGCGAGATWYYLVAQDAAGRRTLYRLAPDAPGQMEALVPNVERLHLLYGLDLDGDGFVDAYQAQLPAGAPQVLSLRVSVLVASAGDGLLREPAELDFAGEHRRAGDRRARRVFSTTIPVR